MREKNVLGRREIEFCETLWGKSARGSRSNACRVCLRLEQLAFKLRYCLCMPTRSKRRPTQHQQRKCVLGQGAIVNRSALGPSWWGSPCCNGETGRNAFFFERPCNITLNQSANAKVTLRTRGGLFKKPEQGDRVVALFQLVQRSEFGSKSLVSTPRKAIFAESRFAPMYVASTLPLIHPAKSTWFVLKGQ